MGAWFAIGLEDGLRRLGGTWFVRFGGSSRDKAPLSLLGDLF
jgi:hypothetical protein